MTGVDSRKIDIEPESCEVASTQRLCREGTAKKRPEHGMSDDTTKFKVEHCTVVSVRK